MRNAFFSNMYQAKTSRLHISVLATIALVFLGSTENLIRIIRQKSIYPAGYSANFMNNALNADAVVSFLPVIAVLPFSGVYVDDIKSKFSHFYLIRSNYRNYLWSRVLVCFLCGGGTILLGGVLSWGISTLLFTPMEMDAQEGIVNSVQLWPVLSLLFLSGGLWSVVGMSMSTLMESKHIAYASPFIIYYLLIILYERYFSGIFLLSPLNWIKPEVWPFGWVGAAIFLLEIITVFAILFVVRAGRRLREL